MKRKTKVAEVSFVVEFFSRSFISVYEAKRIFRMDGNYYDILVRRNRKRSMSRDEIYFFLIINWHRITSVRKYSSDQCLSAYVI